MPDFSATTGRWRPGILFGESNIQRANKSVFVKNTLKTDGDQCSIHFGFWLILNGFHREIIIAGLSDSPVLFFPRDPDR